MSASQPARQNDLKKEIDVIFIFLNVKTGWTIKKNVMASR